jgi:hypothetical protein
MCLGSVNNGLVMLISMQLLQCLSVQKIPTHCQGLGHGIHTFLQQPGMLRCLANFHMLPAVDAKTM